MLEGADATESPEILELPGRLPFADHLLGCDLVYVFVYPPYTQISNSRVQFISQVKHSKYFLIHSEYAPSGYYHYLVQRAGLPGRQRQTRIRPHSLRHETRQRREVLPALLASFTSASCL